MADWAPVVLKTASQFFWLVGTSTAVYSVWTNNYQALYVMTLYGGFFISFWLYYHTQQAVFSLRQHGTPARNHLWHVSLIKSNRLEIAAHTWAQSTLPRLLIHRNRGESCLLKMFSIIYLDVQISLTCLQSRHVNFFSRSYANSMDSFLDGR